MRAVVAIGSGLLAAGLLILAQLQVDSGYGLFLAGILVLGAGMALATSRSTAARARCSSGPSSSYGWLRDEPV